MAEEYKLPYSGIEISRRLKEVDTKANVVAMTTAEYEAIENPNANTLYMITDAEGDDEYYTQIQIDEKIEEINDAISNKSDANHSHDDIYYTKDEAGLMFDTKADSEHKHKVSDIEDFQDGISTKYEKPSTGIPVSDLSDDVQTSLGKANSAIQSLDGYATEGYVDEKVAGLVNSAPETLDTLNELATALGDDPNFATTVATQIGNKADIDHTHEIDNSLSSTSTNPVQNKVINTEISNLKTLVGNTPVSEQINIAMDDSALSVIKLGSGNDSIVIGDGESNGNHSLAGGTNDKSLLTDIVGDAAAALVSAPAPASADGSASISFGAGTVAHSSASMALGVNSQAGCLGYYMWSIDKSSNVITLSKNQKSTYLGSKTKPTKLDWKAGDVVSMVNEGAYPLSATITAVDTTNMTITVDKIPFDSLVTKVLTSAYMPHDLSIYVASSPEKGEVELGFASYAHGYDCKATGGLSTAIGYQNTAIDTASFVTGRKNTGAFASLVGGYQNTVTGGSGFAAGRNNTVTGQDGSVVGQGNTVSGYVAHAEGVGNTASGGQSHAEGSGTKATSDQAHAEGYKTEAGYRSHAEGRETYASGTSHAEGFLTKATNVSHAEGEGTIASGAHQHVQGKYNIEDAAGTYAHIVGNGSAAKKDSEGNITQEEVRSNAHTVDWNGNAWFAGDVSVGKDNKVLATKEFVETLDTESRINYANAIKRTVSGENVICENVSPVQHNIKCTTIAANPQNNGVSGRWKLNNTIISNEAEISFYTYNGELKGNCEGISIREDGVYIHYADEIAGEFEPNTQKIAEKTGDYTYTFSTNYDVILDFYEILEVDDSSYQWLVENAIPLDVNLYCSDTPIGVALYQEELTTPLDTTNNSYRSLIELSMPLIGGKTYYISARNVKSSSGKGCVVYDPISNTTYKDNYLLDSDDDTRSKIKITIPSTIESTSQLYIYSGINYSDSNKEATMKDLLVETNGYSDVYKAEYWNAVTTEVLSYHPITYIAPMDNGVIITAEYNADTNVEITKISDNILDATLTTVGGGSNNPVVLRDISPLVDNIYTYTGDLPNTIYCSYPENLWNIGDVSVTNYNKAVDISLPAGRYVIIADVVSNDTDSNTCLLYNNTTNEFIGQFSRGTEQYIGFVLDTDTQKISFYSSDNYSNGKNDTATFKNIYLYKCLPCEIVDDIGLICKAKPTLPITYICSSYFDFNVTYSKDLGAEIASHKEIIGYKHNNKLNPDCYYRYASDGETEWINPPIHDGEEYRTTERLFGKPVYVQAGTLAEAPTLNSPKYFKVGAEGDVIDKVVSMNVFAKNNSGEYQYEYALPYFTATGGELRATNARTGNRTFGVFAHGVDLTGYTFTYCIKYTKV